VVGVAVTDADAVGDTIVVAVRVGDRNAVMVAVMVSVAIAVTDTDAVVVAVKVLVTDAIVDRVIDEVRNGVEVRDGAGTRDAIRICRSANV